MTQRSLAVAAFAVALLLFPSRRLAAHCDTMDGPVVGAARAALHAGDVTPVLKWIPPAAEPEVRAAFARTMKVRSLGADAREMADLYFFETLVRLHRAGEGEPYTGLKPAGTRIEPAVAAADTSLQDGSADSLVRSVTGTVGQEIRERFERARRLRKSADSSVAAGREYVAAYVELMHYLEAIDQAGGAKKQEHEASQR